MPSDNLNPRPQYATPIQVTGAPIRYGTPIGQGTQLMGTPIPRRSRVQGGDAATPGGTSFSGRMRAASLSVRGAIGSYQHSQTQLYGLFLGSPSNVSHMRSGVDEEGGIMPEGGNLMGEYEWSDEEGEDDDDYDDEEDQEQDDLDARHLFIRPGPALSEHGASPRSILREPGLVASSPDERRLLLTTKVPTYSDETSDSRGRPRGQTLGSNASPLMRRLSTSRRMSVPRPPRGSSSYGQTLFNAIAILLGVGMLSEPLAFAHAGWIGGFVLITFYGFLTCYTAKILARIILADGRLRTYADIGQKTQAPGSLWEAAPTDLAPNWATLPVSFGLFMAGFAGHAVIPSLARDMAEPERFDGMINWAFSIATLIYGIVGAAGYIMFGRGVSDEVSVDLMKIPEYNQTLNRIAVWMLVISPLTKFALCTRPLNITIEIMLGIDQPHTPVHLPERPPSPSHKLQSHADVIPSHHAREKRNKILRAVERISLALAVVAVAILFPEFGVVMAFLGAFSAFMLCVIGPICAKAALNKRLEILDAVLLVIAIGMAAAGTWVAFMTGTGA